MANQGNGRNVAMPDENRPSWRPQDEGGRNRRSMSDDDERSFGRDRDSARGDEERFMARERERMGSQWDDRSSRYDDREDRYGIEHYGQGQSGYAAGRYEHDRSYGSRNQGYGGNEERYRDRGSDERFVGGRGGSAWAPRDRPMRGEMRGEMGRRGSEHSYYGQGEEGWGNQSSYGSAGNMGVVGSDREGGYLGQGGQQMGYGNEQSRRHEGGIQNRYGSQGYQGYQGSQSMRGGMAGMHRGKGPSGYTRSDDRIRELVCEILTDDEHIDATNIEVNVKNGEVTLSGTVEDRHQKRMAEDRIEDLSFVKDVVNQLRVGSTERSSKSGNGSSTSEQHGQTSSDKRHRA